MFYIIYIYGCRSAKTVLRKHNIIISSLVRDCWCKMLAVPQPSYLHVFLYP